MRDARMWLSLDTSDDVWLHLIAPSGRSGLLNIGRLNDRFKGGSGCDVIRELAAHKLAEDERTGNGQLSGEQPPLYAEEYLRSLCCGALVYDARQDKNYTCLMCGRACAVIATRSEPTAQPKTVWQPIETFPKDGEFYLAKGDNFGNATRGRHMAVVRWSASRAAFTTLHSDIFDLCDDCVYHYLTHWTYLPAYPGAAT